MNLYLVSRTDEIDWNEYTKVLVRASSESEALALVLSEGDIRGEPLAGFKKNGSNAKVENLTSEGPSEIVMASHSGA